MTATEAPPAPSGAPAAAGASQRVDARAKATGATHYTADLEPEGALYAVVVRSTVPHALVKGISTAAAGEIQGVVGVYTADDLKAGLSGRRVRDMPLLAGDKVRFTGDRLAVVLAETRSAAEAGAAAVEVDLEELPPVLDLEGALDEGAPRVHDAPWEYDGAAVSEGDHPNLQSQVVDGDPEATEEALASAAWSIDSVYRTPAGHQGYLEPQAWVAVPTPEGRVRLWGTTKSPYRLREQIAECLHLDPADVEIEPVPLGGDFGGKGGLGDAPLCVAMALKSGRPVKLVLRSGEDLASTDARHPSVIRVRLGCDSDGNFVGMAVDALFDGGAYAAAKPVPSVNLHGIVECALGYRFPASALRSRIAYTNNIPKGHMRSPGSPQAVFAVESAVDELATAAGMDPVAIRLRNLLADGDADAYGHTWEEARGAQTLEAAASQPSSVAAPEGWKTARGIAVYARPTPAPAPTSMRMQQTDDGHLLVDVAIPETGTGSHSVVRNQIAAALGVEAESVEIRQASTAGLPLDPGVGASRVTVGVSTAVDQLVAAWKAGDGTGPVTVESDPGAAKPALSYCAQVASVAVDPETAQVKVLEVVTAVDVAEIVRPRAHQLQIDGGVLMGLGFACLEDLLQDEGQIWASNLGEFKLPTAEDSPVLRTVLVKGGKGVPPANVKAIGELTNVPVAAAVANAVAAATGSRLRQLPVTAERLYWEMTRTEEQ